MKFDWKKTILHHTTMGYMLLWTIFLFWFYVIITRSTLKTLEKAEHTPDLSAAGYTTVNLDFRQMGVGGDNSWSPKALPLPRYQLTANEYEFQFVLQP